MTNYKFELTKEIKKHTRLTERSFEFLEGKELRVAMDIAYEAIRKTSKGKLDTKRLKIKNNELELYLLSMSEKINIDEYRYAN